MNRKSARTLVGAVIESLDARTLLAATFTVANTADSGAGSLRAAIAAAAAGDTIDLHQVAGTITLSSELAIDKELTLIGPGADLLTLSGNHANRVIHIDSGLITAISGLTVADGVATDLTIGGGGIATAKGALGNLTLERVHIIGNTSTYGGGGVYGGSVTLTLVDCLIAQNSVDSGVNTGYGGGVGVEDGSLIAAGSTFTGNSVINNRPVMADAYGGGVGIWGSNQGNSSLTNCTIYDNLAGSGNASSTHGSAGGGVGIRASEGDFAMTNCTVVDNTAWDSMWTGASGIDIHLGGTAAAVFTNNLIARNNGIQVDDRDIFSYAQNGTTGSYNLIGEGTYPTFTDGVDHNQVGAPGNPIDANLGTFGDHGGRTPTMSILAGSPAIDAGTANGVPPSDQRIYGRSGATDIGAFEFGSVPFQLPVELTNGLLKVRGTASSDSIQVWVPKASPTQVRVFLNAKAWNFSRTLVTAVQVDALAGDDQVVLNTQVPDSYAYGGEGNDTLLGGPGREILSGGADNDIVNGNEGDDYLNGNGGNDTLYGGRGSDTLNGGGGRDLLDGGSDVDHLHGDAGSDIFHARDDTLDWLFGDNSDRGDSAYIDSLDEVSDVARILA